MTITNLGRTVGTNEGHSYNTCSNTQYLGRTTGYNNGAGYSPAYSASYYPNTRYYSHPHYISTPPIEEAVTAVACIAVGLVVLALIASSVNHMSGSSAGGWSTIRSCGPWAWNCDCETRLFNGIMQYRNCIAV